MTKIELEYRINLLFNSLTNGYSKDLPAISRALKTMYNAGVKDAVRKGSDCKSLIIPT